MLVQELSEHAAIWGAVHEAATEFTARLEGEQFWKAGVAQRGSLSQAAVAAAVAVLGRVSWKKKTVGGQGFWFLLLPAAAAPS